MAEITPMKNPSRFLIEDGLRHIATVYGTESEARVYAAAPALLEALEAAEERVAELETWLVSEIGQHSATYRKARAAIAQAKGESNG